MANQPCCPRRGEYPPTTQARLRSRVSPVTCGKARTPRHGRFKIVLESRWPVHRPFPQLASCEVCHDLASQLTRRCPLLLPRPPGHSAHGSQLTVTVLGRHSDRARLPRAENRPGPGPLRGPLVHRLAPSHHPGGPRPGFLHPDPHPPQSGSAGMTPPPGPARTADRARPHPRRLPPCCQPLTLDRLTAALTPT